LVCQTGIASFIGETINISKSIADAGLGLGPVLEEVEYTVPPPLVYKDDPYKAHST
jgi:hypothetical protein